VNMPQTAYDQKNLNVIARAISGAPQQIRPLGLPRASMFETEDSIVDAEKLTRKSGMLTLPDDDITAQVARFRDIGDQRSKLFNALNQAQMSFNDKKSAKNANALYKGLRDYTKTLFNAAQMTSTKTGIGQQFEVNFTNMPILSSTIRDAAKVLREQGSTERAELLEKIANIKQDLRGFDNFETKEAQRARQELMKTVPKLNKGGLVARKR
jgi:hypothetical protein